MSRQEDQWVEEKGDISKQNEPINEPIPAVENPSVNSHSEPTPLKLSNRFLYNQFDIFKRFPVPLGCVYTPNFSGSSGNRNALDLHREPVSCSHCGAIINQYCGLSDLTKGNWKCCFCSEVNCDEEGFFRDGDKATFPELTSKSVAYVDPTRQAREWRETEENIGFTPVEAQGGGQQQQQNPWVFVVDVTASAPELERLLGEMREVLPTLGKRPVGLIVFDSCTHIYKLSEQFLSTATLNCSAADCTTPPPLTQLLEFPRVYFAAADERTMAVKFGGQETLAHPLLAALQVWVYRARRRRSRLADSHRARGSVIYHSTATALALLQHYPDTVGPTLARILVCLPGGNALLHSPATFSLSTSHSLVGVDLALFEALSADAAAARVSVDIHHSGFGLTEAPALEALVTKCEGDFFFYEQFDSSFRKNLVGVDLQEIGYHGTLSLRLSTAPVHISHVFGPEGPCPKTCPGFVQRKDAHFLRFSFPRIKRHRAWSFLFQVDEDVLLPDVFVQAVFNHVTPHGRRKLHVTTTRLKVTGNLKKYIAAVDADVATALLVKSHFALSHTDEHPRPDSLLGLTDLLAAALAQSHGQEAVTTDSPLSPLRFLDHLPLCLYHLMYTPAMRVPPNTRPTPSQLIRRFHLLRGDVSATLAMALPVLFLVAEAGLERVTPGTLALHSARSLLLDVGTVLYIWRGAQSTLTPSMQSAIDDYVSTAEADRYPRPVTLTVQERAPEERWVWGALIPDHTDPPTLWHVAHPFRKTSPKLERPLPPTEAPSFRQFISDSLHDVFRT